MTQADRREWVRRADALLLALHRLEENLGSLVDRLERSEQKTAPPQEATEGVCAHAPGQTEIVPHIESTSDNIHQPSPGHYHATPTWEKLLGVTATVIAFGLLVVNLVQMRATQKAADAARSAAETASRQLELTQRPWLSWQDMKLTSAFIFGTEGARVGLQALIKNSGASPAVAVTSGSESYLGDADPAIVERERFCIELTQQKPSYGQTVFPNTTTLQAEWARVKMKDLNARASPGLGKNRIIGPNIITCIAYRSTFDPAARYYTSAILTVSRSTAENPRLSLIIIVGENVPLERLIFSFLPVGAIIAK